MEPNNPPQRPRHREWTGVFLVIVGGLLLANKLNAGIPNWIFTWPVLLMAIGLLNGLQHNFRNPAWFILIIVGGAFFIDQQFYELRVKELIWPGVLILIGLAFIFRRRGGGGDKRFIKDTWKKEWKQDWKDDWEKWNKSYDATKSDGEYIDSTNVFGGAKKVVLSKNFRGGDITCFFGGSEIDLSQADVQSPVILDVTMVFGGLKLTVPSHWDIKNHVTPIFGSVEDKRAIAVTNFDPNKALVLTGTALFAGIEIRNF